MLLRSGPEREGLADLGPEELLVEGAHFLGEEEREADGKPLRGCEDDEEIPCPVVPCEDGHKAKHPGESRDGEYTEVHAEI